MKKLLDRQIYSTQRTQTTRASTRAGVERKPFFPYHMYRQTMLVSTSIPGAGQKTIPNIENRDTHPIAVNMGYIMQKSFPSGEV